MRSGRRLGGRARLVKNAEAFLTHRAIFVTLGQYFSVAGNDLLIPAKGFLLIAIAASGPVVIQVDIDETVTLAQLTCSEGYNVNTSPVGCLNIRGLTPSAPP